MTDRTPVEAPKHAWFTLLRDIDQMTFSDVPHALTSVTMDSLSRIEELQRSFQRTMSHLIEKHAAREDGKPVMVGEGHDRSVDAYDTEALFPIGNGRVLLEDPEAFREDREKTLSERVTVDLRLLSIEDLDVPLGRVRQSPLRMFIKELQPEGVRVVERG